MFDLAITPTRVVALVDKVELAQESILEVFENPAHVEVLDPPADRFHDETQCEYVVGETIAQVDILKLNGHFLAVVHYRCVHLGEASCCDWFVVEFFEDFARRQMEFLLK